MTLRKYSTNTRIWWIVSLALFVIPWFIPMAGKSGEHWYALMFLLWVFDPGPGQFGEALTFLGFYVFLFGVPALVIGWVIQCVIVMARDRLKGVHHAGSTSRVVGGPRTS
jgi:hypothetical protein